MSNRMNINYTENAQNKELEVLEDWEEQEYVFILSGLAYKTT